MQEYQECILCEKEDDVGCVLKLHAFVFVFLVSFYEVHVESMVRRYAGIFRMYGDVSCCQSYVDCKYVHKVQWGTYIHQIHTVYTNEIRMSAVPKESAILPAMIIIACVGSTPGTTQEYYVVVYCTLQYIRYIYIPASAQGQ